MRLRLLLFVVLASCDAVEDDLPGKLVRVEVIAENEGCVPARFTGDAGVQFFGEREDGGFVITMGSQAQFGPNIDGGSLIGVERSFPSALSGAIEGNPRCTGTLNDWTRTVDGLRLRQQLPGTTSCSNGPVWLPATLGSCVSVRRFIFTEVGTCPLRCVRVPIGGSEIECQC